MQSPFNNISEKGISGLFKNGYEMSMEKNLLGVEKNALNEYLAELYLP